MADSLGQVKALTTNFSFIIPEFNSATWHDYIEANFRSIDALLYNIFEINQYQGLWTTNVVYSEGDVVFVGEDNDSDYEGKLVKILNDDVSTAGYTYFTDAITAEPENYELFLDAQAAEVYASLAKKYAIQETGTIVDDKGVDTGDYSAKYHSDAAGTSATAAALSATNSAASESTSTTQAGIATSQATIATNAVTGFTTVVSSATSDFNDNAEAKTDAFDSNYDTKIAIVNTQTTLATTAATTATEKSEIATTQAALSTTNATQTTSDLATITTYKSEIETIADEVEANKTLAETAAGTSAQDALDAANSATAALASQGLAQVYATSSGTSAQNASTSEGNASNSAIESASSATASASSADDAENWAIGTITENPDGSAKYWAEQSASGQVNASWTETDTTSKAFIVNKPTTVATSGITDIYTKTEVDSAISTATSSLATTTALTTGLAGKVDTVTGKGLSTNDLTDSLKTQIETATSTLANVTTEATASSIPRSNTSGKLNAGWIPIATDDTFATGTSTTEVPNVAQIQTGLSGKADTNLSNTTPSDTFKETAMAWEPSDVSTRVSISSGYVTTYDCYLYVYSTGASSTNTVAFNGVTVYNMQSATSYYGRSGYIRCGKGVTITTSGTFSALEIDKCIGAN